MADLDLDISDALGPGVSIDSPHAALHVEERTAINNKPDADTVLTVPDVPGDFATVSYVLGLEDGTDQPGWRKGASLLTGEDFAASPSSYPSVQTVGTSPKTLPADTVLKGSAGGAGQLGTTIYIPKGAAVGTTCRATRPAPPGGNGDIYKDADGRFVAVTFNRSAQVKLAMGVIVPSNNTSVFKFGLWANIDDAETYMAPGGAVLLQYNTTPTGDGSRQQLVTAGSVSVVAGRTYWFQQNMPTAGSTNGFGSAKMGLDALPAIPGVNPGYIWTGLDCRRLLGWGGNKDWTLPIGAPGSSGVDYADSDAQGGYPTLGVVVA
jgi:hypothetical protein